MTTQPTKALFAYEHEDLLQGDLEAMIVDYARSDKRSLQRTVGPSELGQSCERRLAMTLLGTEPVNDDRDEWTSSVGTAIHAWMEAAALHANAVLLQAGQPARWLVEQTVDCGGVIGHTDLYDLWTHTVLDHKFPGVTSIRKYRKAGEPPQEYRWQAHTYGLGWKQMGFPVRNVAIAFYPRSGLVRDTWLWQEPFDESIAAKALDRKDGLLVAMDVAEGMGGEDGLRTVVESLDRDTTNCSWCPFFQRNMTDPLVGCKGPFYDPDHSDPRDMAIPGILA